MKDMIREIYRIGIVPVVVLDDAKYALPLAKALAAGGINCAEVTFRTAAAEESIKIISKELPDMLVGAGTVLTTAQVDSAIKAGAKFIVSPGLNPVVAKYCIEKGITIIPGCSNPSDIEVALSLGIDTVKFFPAEAAGGIKMIKAMAAPYTNVTFIPTGGVDIKNLNTYLDFKKVVACGGSWMVSKELVKNEDFEGITRLTKEAISQMHGFSLKHIGINGKDKAEAHKIAEVFGTLFGFAKRETSISVFAGNQIEVMYPPCFGKNGHVGIAANSVERAAAYLAKLGIEFNKDTAKYDDMGNLTFIYFKDEICGFAVHLIQK